MVKRLFTATLVVGLTLLLMPSLLMAGWAERRESVASKPHIFYTDDTECGDITQPMFEVIVGSPPSANQELFGVSTGTPGSTTSVFKVDEDGDAVMSGNLTVTGGSVTLGTSAVLSGGDTASLDNIDAIDATTETTLESSLDSFGSLAEGGLADATILEADLKAVDTPGDEECLTYESTGGDFEWQTCGGGGTGAFSDAADPVVLNTTTKDVVIGTGAVNTSKLSIDGDADQVQLTVQGNATQTGDIFIIEESDGTDILTADTSDVTIPSINTFTMTSVTELDLADGTLLDLSSINMSGTTEGLVLGQSTSCASATAEGQVCWDSDTDVLSVGDGTDKVTVGVLAFGGSTTLSWSQTFRIRGMGAADAANWKAPFDIEFNGPFDARIENAPGAGNSWSPELDACTTETDACTCTISGASATFCTDAVCEEHCAEGVSVNAQFIETGTASATGGAGYSLRGYPEE